MTVTAEIQITDRAQSHIMEQLKKSGSWFSYGETRLGQGRDSIKNLLMDNPELAEELEHKIKEALVTPETKSSVLQD